MKCKILHESKGRIRVHLMCGRMTLAEADILEYYLRNFSNISQVKVYDRTRDVVVLYKEDKASVIEAMASFSFADKNALALVPEHTSRAVNYSDL